MLNARHRFALLWQRLVAALSLVMAAVLAPAAISLPAGAGAVGSRVGTGAPVASAASGLATTVVALAEGGAQRGFALDKPTDGTGAKACTLTPRVETAPLRHVQGVPPLTDATAPPTHAARSGPSRAPPAA
jgi:hypothetical protein